MKKHKSKKYKLLSKKIKMTINKIKIILKMANNKINFKINKNNKIYKMKILNKIIKYYRRCFKEHKKTKKMD